MRRGQNQVLVGVTMLVVAGIVAVNVGIARRRTEEAAKRQGRYSPAQVMRLAAELCQRVEPENTPSYFVAECDRVPALYRHGHPEWTVRCTHAPAPKDGKTVADMIYKWDAVTGRLITVSRQFV